MKNLLLLPLAVLMMTACTTQRVASNPFIGTWTSDFDGCIESYEFRPDGSRTYVSNQEKGIANYKFTKLGDHSYKMEDVITKTNGGTDCFGEAGVPVGHKVTLYIKLQNNDKEMVMCADPNFRQCVQPFVKQ